jgi:hypothetical protein
MPERIPECAFVKRLVFSGSFQNLVPFFDRQSVFSRVVASDERRRCFSDSGRSSGSCTRRVSPYHWRSALLDNTLILLSQSKPNVFDEDRELLIGKAIKARAKLLGLEFAIF